MIDRFRKRNLLLLLAVAGFGFLQQVAGAADVESIKQAWRERQNRVEKGVIIDLEIELTYLRGGMNQYAELLNDSNVNEWPQQDSIVRGTRRVVMRSGKIRLEDTSVFDFSGLAQEAQKVHSSVGARTETFDGTGSQMMFMAKATQSPTEAALREGHDTMMANQIVMTPLFKALTPFVLKLSEIDCSQMSLVEAGADSPKGVSPTIVEFRGLQQSPYHRLLLDANSEFAPVKIELLTNDEATRFVADVQYQKHPSLGVVPAAWSHTLFNRDSRGVSVTSKVRVREVKVDVDIPDATFTIQFPKGTIVDDERSDDFDSVLLAVGNGELRRMTRQEASRVSKAAPDIPKSNWRLPVSFVVSFGLLGSLVWFLRRRVRTQ